MKLSIKLFNITLITFICFLLLKSSDLIVLIINKIYEIVFPVFIGFSISYFLYPILCKLNKKIPKKLSLGILILSIFLILTLTLILLTPLLYKEFISITSYILIFLKDVSIKYDIDLSSITDKLFNIFDNIITIFTKYIGKGIIKTINISVDIITNIIVIIVSFIYFLIDMDKIRKFFYKNIKNKKLFNYLKLLDNELTNYFNGLSNLIIISFFEYTIIYYIVGNPNYLLLGILSSLSNFIPCFGALIVYFLAFTSSFVISVRKGILTIVVIFILSIFDNYILNPYIFKKSNKIHPLIVIISIFIGGKIFGMFGILISLPLSIIIINTIKFLTKNVNGM